MRDTIDMAREAGCDELYAERVLIGIRFKTHSLKTFEALVRADEREIVMNEPLTKAQWQRFEDEIRADEREACAKVCEDIYMRGYGNCGDAYDAIRERSSSLCDSANAGARGNT